MAPIRDELIKARHIQGAVAPQFSPVLAPAAPVPEGLSSASSIGAANSFKEIPNLRPSLQQPRNVCIDICNLQMETERLSDEEAVIFGNDFRGRREEIKNLEKERQEALVKEAEAASSRKTWSAVSTVAQTVVNVSMIGAGVAIGGWPGLLIAIAGGAGVAKDLSQATGLIESSTALFTESKQLQSDLTHKIETVLILVQIGAGVAGGVGAWHTGALAAAQINNANLLNSSKTVLGGGAQLVSAGAKIGASKYDQKMAYLQADHKKLDTKITLEQQRLHENTTHMSKMIESNRTQEDVARKAIQDQEVPID
jgi:hypothetical protein